MNVGLQLKVCVSFFCQKFRPRKGHELVSVEPSQTGSNHVKNKSVYTPDEWKNRQHAYGEISCLVEWRVSSVETIMLIL
jgi:hypothetical protein